MFSALFALLAATPATPAPLPSTLPAPLPSTLSTFQFQQVTFGATHPLLVGIVEWLFVGCAVGLVGLMSFQTTKNEGLSGSIGGRTESAYRGRLGLDQQLARLTSGFAVAFVFLAIAYFLVTR